MSSLHRAASVQKSESGMLETLAKRYLERVRVFYARLPEKVLGCVEKVDDQFIIKVDDQKTPCPIQRIFIVLHEVRHAVRGDPGHWRPEADADNAERDCNRWALAEGEFDEVCTECILALSQACLKGYKALV